jgi:hypothetical protein
MALIAHKRLNTEMSLRNFMHLLEVNMFEKITLAQMVANAAYTDSVQITTSQTELF